MKLVDIREQLALLNAPVITIQDVIGILNVEKSHASHILSRLVKAKSLVHIKRGLWAWPKTDPLTIPTYLTEPLPCYISLQSALFYHGVIEQIPARYYVVSLARKNTIKTPLGIYSIHNINSKYFEGYEIHYDPFFQLATAEKSFFDYIYFSKIDPKEFGKLPEIDISKINEKKLLKLIDRIDNEGLKTFMRMRIKSFFNNV